MFMHPWAITAGMAALSLPFIVHFLTKPRPTRMHLSTIRFINEIIQQRRARNRLRDWLILLLRAAAVALFAFVLSRPLSGNRATPNTQNQGQTVRIVLLDISQSMAAESNGIQAFERARSIAARQVEYRSGMLANLILGAAAPRAVFDRPSTNVAALVDEVSRAAPLPQRLQVQASLNSAAEMLAASSGVKHELIIISDFQRTNWVSADFSVLPTDTEIQLESVAATETPTNLAITRVSPQGRAEQGRPIRMEVEIGNFSPAPRQVSVELTLGDSQFQLQGTCTAGNNSVLVTEIKLPKAGWLIGEARLVGIDDGLSADNRMAVVLQVHQQPMYLLLTRQLADSKANSSYFLERAIVPTLSDNRKDRTAEQIVRSDPSRVDRDAILAADLIVLDHPGKLSDETIELLGGLMLRGRGVLYVAAEPIDASNLKMLAKAAGTSLQMPVEFVPPGSGQTRKNLFLTDVKRRQIPFSIFGEETPAIVSPLRFGGGLSSRRLEGALLDDVCATYNDQSACLVVTACGAGSLAVINAELSASNLPSSPAFVPLIGELVAHLLGRSRPNETVFSGEPIAVFLPSDASPVTGLQIEPPARTAMEPGSLGELHDEAIGVVWQAAAAGPPGAYKVERSGNTLYALASTIPPEEADLSTLAADLMTTRLSGGRDVKYRSAMDPEDSRDDLWSKLAIVCLTCIFAEFVGLKMFRC